MALIRTESTPDKVEMESLPCPLGCPAGPTENEFVLTGRDRLHDLPGEFNVVRCKTCNLIRTDPRPTPESIGFYYPDAYGPWRKSSKLNSLPNQKPLPAWKKIIKDLLFGKPLITTPPIPPGRLLEIGCGNGTFLNLMALKGWQVQGIEYSSKAGEAVINMGYPVHVGPLESAPAPKDPFDLIVGWHVLEHLHNPIVALNNMSHWLKPNGYLVLSMPNAASFEFKLFKSRWYALHLPNHLYHFTPKTLKKILTSTGWKIEKVTHEKNIANLMASFGYFLKDKFSENNALANFCTDFPTTESKIKYYLTPLARMLASIGQTGRMIIWAKKL